MSCRKPGKGIFDAAILVYGFRIRRKISTSISWTSCVWKEKVRFMGKTPPTLSSISARPAV
jgi:hypothetical protein